MKLFKAAPAVLGMAFLGAAFSPSAKADDNDKKTTVTFSGPVEIPPVYITGMRMLPAGTYVFKLVNSSSNRHIVQIFNKDETKIYATVLAIPNYRLVPKSKTVITFNEGIQGATEADPGMVLSRRKLGRRIRLSQSQGCRTGQGHQYACSGPPGRSRRWKSRSPRNRPSSRFCSKRPSWRSGRREKSWNSPR